MQLLVGSEEIAIGRIDIDVEESDIAVPILDIADQDIVGFGIAARDIVDFGIADRDIADFGTADRDIVVAEVQIVAD